MMITFKPINPDDLVYRMTTEMTLRDWRDVMERVGTAILADSGYDFWRALDGIIKQATQSFECDDGP